MPRARHDGAVERLAIKRWTFLEIAMRDLPE